MKPEIAEMWVNALRSGDYKQVRGTLYDGHGFCALGVLYDLVKTEGVKWCCPPGAHAYLVDLHGRNVSSELAAIAGYTGDNDIIDRNDRQEQSFSEIADVIEARYLEPALCLS